MSTRSTIWVETKEGFKGVYCQNDGYLSHNGAILYIDYTDLDKVSELINGGGLSSLGGYITPINYNIHNFNNRQDNICCFYARDRGDSLKIFNADNFKEAMSLFEEYNYFFIYGVWYYEKNGELLILTSEAILEEWGGEGFIHKSFIINEYKKLKGY